ncbi:MAG TPA: polymer-forming cytoskeletal protein [Steroidobacteraceae bacterium]|nr:polymer-forming cytoskeletal protein [Steroidobacteraceae bacterium]
MFGRRDRSGRIDTLIGRNAAIQGDIEFAGGLHVDGRVAGSVRAATDGSLSVSEFGVIDGSVAASQVVVNGRVCGDIYATERVVLGSKARVRGNVHYGVFEIALGAEINGKLVPLGHGQAGGSVAEAAADEGSLPMAEGL